MEGSNSLNKAGGLKNDLLFIFLFTVFAAFYYHSVLDKGPRNTHVWRQTDCLSFTRNYSEGADFFKPSMNLLLADKNTSGLTVGEFPVLYYIVGNIWKLFGESYFSYRLFYFFILFAGVFSFYRSLRLLLNNSWALAISLLLFTSPVYAAYSVSFLTDAPAFSFLLVALYFFVNYCVVKGRRFFLLSMGFFALAGLLKVSSLIVFVFLFFILVLESFSFRSLGNRKLFERKKLEWPGFISVIVVVFSWYYYANYFNTLHGFKFTFNNIYPGSVSERGGIGGLANDISNFTSYLFFSRAVLLALFFIGVLNLFLWKRIPAFAYLANSVITLGGLIYFILFFPLMAVHDYYYVALLALFIGIVTPFAWFVKTNYPEIFNGKLLRVFLAIFLLYNFLYCFNVVKLKMGKSEGNFAMVGNRELVDMLKWANWDTNGSWERFETMQPYIRRLGIKKEDKVISLPDASFNVSLYFSGQKGWTDHLRYRKTADLEKLVQKGAKYLFVSDRELLNKDYLLPFLNNRIGEYKGIAIFKLQ